MIEGQLPLFPESQESEPAKRDITEIARQIGAAARPFKATDRTSEAARDQGWGPPVGSAGPKEKKPSDVTTVVDDTEPDDHIVVDGAVPMPQHVRDQLDESAKKATVLPLGTVPRHVADSAANDAFWRKQARNHR